MREDLVVGEAVALAHAHDQLVPRQLTGRRVGEGVRERLRAGRLDGGEARLLLEVREDGEAGVVVRGEGVHLAGGARGEREQLQDVRADQALGAEQAQLPADEGAAVAAVCAVARPVAEAPHQGVPGQGHSAGAPAAVAGGAGEGVAGHGGHDDVEGVGRVAAVGPGVGERADHLGELGEGAGPAVGQDQRQGVRLGRPDVQEVHVRAVDLGGELRELVQPGLVRPPVVTVAPVRGQALDDLDGHPVRPGLARGVGGPAGAREALAQVVQVTLGDLDAEGADLLVRGHGHGHGHGRGASCALRPGTPVSEAFDARRAGTRRGVRSAQGSLTHGAAVGAAAREPA